MILSMLYILILRCFFLGGMCNWEYKVYLVDIEEYMDKKLE